MKMVVVLIFVEKRDFSLKRLYKERLQHEKELKAIFTDQSLGILMVRNMSK